MRRIILFIFIIMVAMIPVPIFFQKKEGKFNDDNTIELVETKEDDAETKTVKFSNELKS
ncbi:hypothetical protein [Aquimarina sp. 2201CG14-23]|uniref:hypothetical protein n=1 Tax=Aquimarina mycalae TaxID=3040073 RepID=UPI0024782A6B|nr:hypothetical protein [Aquimarina sp. 2201CG14-23]MDH7444621.1 hypothetical protein [Aquimarina sp. 2201CG14-23]